MNATTLPDDGAVHGRNIGSAAYRRYVVLSLLGVYTLNFIDRQLLGVMAQPIIAQFDLTDTQYGFLNGPPFALFYALMGIPLAMAADRFNRVRILALCIALWSVMTALCGLATGFVFLLIARIGVAIGEAGCTPPANSIIGDYFRPGDRALAPAPASQPVGEFLAEGKGSGALAVSGDRQFLPPGEREGCQPLFLPGERGVDRRLGPGAVRFGQGRRRIASQPDMPRAARTARAQRYKIGLRIGWGIARHRRPRLCPRDAAGQLSRMRKSASLLPRKGN